MKLEIVVYAMINTLRRSENTLRKNFIVSSKIFEDEIKYNRFLDKAMKEILIENRYDIRNPSNAYYRTWNLVRHIRENE